MVRFIVVCKFVGAFSCVYFEVVGMWLCAWAWGVMAHHAKDDDFGVAKKQTARFFFTRLLPRTLGLEQGLTADSDVLMEMPEALFNA